MPENNDHLIIGGRKIRNRFFLGTGKFGDKATMLETIKQCGTEVVTVALRRVDEDKNPENIIEYIPEDTILMINTSGARDAEEAVKIARIAREALNIDWVKIEVINDSKYLLPDNNETVKSTRILVEEGFTVLPYMHPDLYTARELQKAGAAAVMPLGSLIGSGQGLKAKKFIEILISEIDLPIIVDAGIGVPSQAAEAMEMGAAAVLANTAVAIAGDPVSMAKSFSLAVQAGRMAYLSLERKFQQQASASSPLTGFLFEDKP
jgi:thiazole synthase